MSLQLPQKHALNFISEFNSNNIRTTKNAKKRASKQARKLDRSL